MSNLSKSKLANEKTKKTTLPPPSSHTPWKTVGETSKSKWKKSSDAAVGLCIIVNVNRKTMNNFICVVRQHLLLTRLYPLLLFSLCSRLLLVQQNVLLSTYRSSKSGGFSFWVQDGRGYEGEVLLPGVELCSCSIE